MADKINGIPKTERIWVKRTTSKGEVFYTTSKENDRSYYFLYKMEGDKAVKLGKAFSFKLIENTCRYSPAHIDMLFSKSDKVINKKQGSKHPMRFVSGMTDWFVIYPYQAGIPFSFDLVKEF